jgi:hypothetical protein
MQNTQTTETRGVVAFQTKLETIPGGMTVAIADVVEDILYAGTPIGVDSSTRLGHIVKCAEMQATATNTATDYRVIKGHNFAVGDHICSAEGAKAQTITAITTTETAYDTLTVGTSIGVEVADGAWLYQSSGASQSTGSDLKYDPIGLIGEDIDMTASDNHLVSVVVRGSAIVDNIPPIGTVITAKLPLIRFVTIID